mgnify:CR=1 FL=1
MADAPPNLDMLVRELTQAQDRLIAARQAERVANAEVVEWINQINDLQKQIDDALAELRRTADPSSDWKRRADRG